MRLDRFTNSMPAHNVRPMNKDLEKFAAQDVKLAVDRGDDGARLLSLHGAKDFLAWHPVHDILAVRFDVMAPVFLGFGGSARASDVETVDELTYSLSRSDPRCGLGAGFGGRIAAE